jgi:hypothetical protein
VSPEEEKEVSKQLNKLIDPGHEAKLRAIRSQAALQSMLRGPGLRGENPKDVIKAYNRIVSLAPHVADQPMALESMIRRHLAQGSQADVFDVLQTADLESKLKMKDPSLLPIGRMPIQDMFGGGGKR